MEYERIEKVQKGIISPTKLRMMLKGPHHIRKREASSNCNSSRTSPSRPHDSEFAKNSLLLASQSDVLDDDDHEAVVANMDVREVDLPGEPVLLDLSQSDNVSSSAVSKEAREMDCARPLQQQFRKGTDLSMVHPMRPPEDENLDYDSNASSSSFEFPNGGERPNRSHAPRSSYPRHVPSKWNDAEKWIMNRPNVSKKNESFHGQGNRVPVRVAPENAGYEHSKPRTAADTLSQPFPGHGYGGNMMFNQQSTQSRDLGEAKNSSLDTTGAAGPAVRSVCMRDMGTEMTPAASQEPSRTATPVGATTPLRSPSSSLPSTPRAGGGGRATSGQEVALSQGASESVKREVLSEEEMKQRTRREIVALGVQLGKTSIAAWASKEKEGNDGKNADFGGKASDFEGLQRIEYEKRAASWEEAEKSKHAARYKREEIEIQAWESQEKAKLEAEMRRIEAKVEQMKAQAEAKMVKKIAMAKQRSEEKRAAAEARKKRDAEKAKAEAEYIRRTGRIPAYGCICCGGWFS